MAAPPGTTANTAAAIAKLMAAVAGIYLIFTAIFYAVSNFI